jgi:SAM-dependent methyltransferase
MSLTAPAWHERFIQQAAWTQPLRRHLYASYAINQARRSLDLGCGTGVITEELCSAAPGSVFGLDINRSYLALAQAFARQSALAQGDAYALPYKDQAFDCILFHFFLLWIADPAPVLAEAMRATRPGGAILALAEPDYGGRIDYPAELGQLGDWQMTALRNQSAEPLMGRRLAHIFAQAGLVDIETGLLGGQWKSGRYSEDAFEREWAVLRADLEAIQAGPPQSLVDELYQIDRAACQRGERILFVPTFYAAGRVPG